MKIRAFHADDGGCLLIRGDDDTVILADGGRSTAFTGNIASRLTRGKLRTDIDLVYVSHIDNDHLSGILDLVKTKIAWEVRDYLGRRSKRPALPRPAAIRQIWHNGFAELVDDRDGTIERALDLATRTLARSKELLSGLRQHGLITDDRGLHVDVLKVQHHGAAGNVTEEFAKLVTADHIFCANGSHSDPEKVVLDGILDFRIGERADENLSPGRDRPFTFWFTTGSGTPGITSSQKRFLKSVERRLSEKWDDKPGFTRKYTGGADPFSIEIVL